MTECVVGTVEETLENKHQAKDGLWYPSYQAKAAANKRRNLEVLKEKNLVSFSESMKKVSPSPPKKKRKAAASKAPTEIRKSRRLRKEPASHKPLEFLEEEPRAPRKPRSPRKSKPKGLSEEDMKKLKNLPDWLDEMEEFLLTVPHGSSNKPVSSDNCRTVMRQVKLLVSGVGVGYRWWPNVSMVSYGIFVLWRVYPHVLRCAWGQIRDSHFNTLPLFTHYGFSELSTGRRFQKEYQDQLGYKLVQIVR